MFQPHDVWPRRPARPRRTESAGSRVVAVDAHEVRLRCDGTDGEGEEGRTKRHQWPRPPLLPRASCRSSYRQHEVDDVIGAAHLRAPLRGCGRRSRQAHGQPRDDALGAVLCEIATLLARGHARCGAPCVASASTPLVHHAGVSRGAPRPAAAPCIAATDGHLVAMGMRDAAGTPACICATARWLCNTGRRTVTAVAVDATAGAVAWSTATTARRAFMCSKPSTATCTHTAPAAAALAWTAACCSGARPAHRVAYRIEQVLPRTDSRSRPPRPTVRPNGNRAGTTGPCTRCTPASAASACASVPWRLRVAPAVWHRDARRRAVRHCRRGDPGRLGRRDRRERPSAARGA